MNIHVVIPIYRPTLDPDERISLRQADRVLASTPITVIKPAGLDISAILEEFPRLRVEEFDPAYFASKISYNALMLSRELYSRFLDLDYILIYQLDAFVFRDELAEWCAREYDYIGGPWLNKSIYGNPFYKLLSALKSALLRWTGKAVPERHISRGKVGNGGFSLRRIRAHLDVVTRDPQRVRDYVEQSEHHRFYEDVFWAVEAVKIDPEFRIPPVEEALRFAFDKYPTLSFLRNRGRLPFGCHGFNKRKAKRFWRPIVAAWAVK